MAINATVFKATLQIADIERHYYADHHLTIARHPSETDARMMVRLLAFILYADERLTFGKGLSTDDEPALWIKDYTDAIKLWIDVGMPDERNLRKACGRADSVVLLTYGRVAEIWWKQNHDKLQRLQNLTVLHLPEEDMHELVKLTERTMLIQCNIQEDSIMLTSDLGMVQLEVLTWLKAQR